MQYEKINNDLDKTIRACEISQQVVEKLLPGGNPHSFESDLWDYKLEFPNIDNSDNKKQYEFKYHGIVKDIVSFHNSYGGYLIFGIKDKGDHRVVGCPTEIDIDELSQRVYGYTGKKINFYFQIMNLQQCKIGILLVPRRPYSVSPISFVKNGPVYNDKKPYKKGDIYIRKQSRCIAATNSIDDWQFLFSERKIDSTKSVKTVSVPNNLPARDADLVKFVGRDAEIENLRKWALDEKSPIRLLSGIGGLGKTSLAYRFAEEASTTGSGDIESIVWITAKQETFAALRGKMVPTSRHDFANIEELLARLISEISGSSSIVDGADNEELADILVDGLSFRPSLIIVDDLDSLTPEDQKECTAVLQQIALRTVGREHTPTRFLLTSRLDQGMPPTAVIEVSGLGRDAFGTHLENLCGQFGIQKLTQMIQNSIFRITSGSPLFGGAIVRLIKLGDDPKKVCEIWEKNAGEDVREFAFKRELERLSPKAAEILLTIIRLGETSKDEVCSVLDLQSRQLSDLIGELQGYHLVSRTENKFGETVFSASKELVSVVGILQKHLGKERAGAVDIECARISKNQGDKTRSIGIGINKIVSFWSEQKMDEALILAKELSAKNPRNGDVFCILGKSFLQVAPKKYNDAETALMKAIEFGSKRVELTSLVIEAKCGCSDWLGLRTFLSGKKSKFGFNDPILDALIIADENLYANAMASGRLGDASNYAVEIVEKIADKILGQVLKADYFDTLRHKQTNYANRYLEIVKLQNNRSGDKLEIANAVFRLFDLNIATSQFFITACNSLNEWLTDVESRPVLDLTALDILVGKINSLRKIEDYLLKKRGESDHVYKKVGHTIRELEFRGARLSG